MHRALSNGLVALTSYSVTKKYKNDQNLISISGDKVVKRLLQGKKVELRKSQKTKCNVVNTLFTYIHIKECSQKHQNAPGE